MAELDTFTQQYITTALWSSTDDDDTPMDARYSVDDLASETLDTIKADCAKFQREQAALIGSELSRAGHDFWLTRNGHGAGFWDGDWPEQVGETLTEASHAFGQVTIYRGDDGKLYIGPG